MLIFKCVFDVFQIPPKSTLCSSLFNILSGLMIFFFCCGKKYFKFSLGEQQVFRLLFLLLMPLNVVFKLVVPMKANVKFHQCKYIQLQRNNVMIVDFCL